MMRSLILALCACSGDAVIVDAPSCPPPIDAGTCTDTKDPAGDDACCTLLLAGDVTAQVCVPQGTCATFTCHVGSAGCPVAIAICRK